MKGTLGWVSAPHAVQAEIRLYDRLFKTENLNSIDDDFRNHLNPDSLQVITNAVLEPSVKQAKEGDQFQFERQGYFIVDKNSTDDHLISIGRFRFATIGVRNNEKHQFKKGGYSTIPPFFWPCLRYFLGLYFLTEHINLTGVAELVLDRTIKFGPSIAGVFYDSKDSGEQRAPCNFEKYFSIQ